MQVAEEECGPDRLTSEFVPLGWCCPPLRLLLWLCSDSGTPSIRTGPWGVFLPELHLALACAQLGTRSHF